MWINLPEPYETVVLNLKGYYAEKANQGMVEHLIRADALRLGLWPVGAATLPQGRDEEVPARNLPTLAHPPVVPAAATVVPATADTTTSDIHVARPGVGQ